MKPLLVYVLEATSGGAKRHVVDALTGLSSRGWNCALFYSEHRADSSFARELNDLQERGVATRCVPMRKDPLSLANLKSAWAIHRCISREFGGRSVILHGHSSIGGACARMTNALLALKSQGRPTVYTPHTPATQFTRLNPLKRLLYSAVEIALSHWTSAIAAVGQDEYTHIQDWPIRSRIVLVPNGVPSQRIRIPPPNERRNDFLWVGRFSEEKDPLAAIRIAASLPSCTLQLAGDGHLFGEAKGLINSLGIQDRVFLLGHVKDPLPLYLRSKYLLVTSQYEGHPYAVLEAMSHGCAIAGLRAPGVSPLLQRSGNFLMDRKDPERECQKMLEWIRTHADKRAAANIEWCAEHYSLESMISRLERLYLSLLTRPSRQGR